MHSMTKSNDNELKKLKEENEKLKEQLSQEKSYNSTAWDFHWDGRGSYEESRRCFYGDFS